MKSDNRFLFNSLLFVVYLFVVAFAIYNHELWGDEIHSWNIVKGSNSLHDLFLNIRYEGHPPLWYLFLFCFTQFTHSLLSLKILQFTFSAIAAAIVLFYSPFSKLIKLLILFGYYFIFEYALLARNYMPAIVAAFCLAILFSKNFKYKTACYYFLLFALSNVHLLGLVLAASIHAGFLFENSKGKSAISIHIISGILVLLPAIYFIMPPADSELNFTFWKGIWTSEKFYLFKTVIVKSLLPIQDFNNPHWWNTHFIIDNPNYLFISRLIFVLLIFSICFTVGKNKTALVILIVNLILTYLLSIIFPLNTARYVGFVFIGFLVSTWLSYESMPSVNKNILIALLLLQIPAGVFAVSKDATQKFSCASSVVEMYNAIPPDSFVTTDTIKWFINVC